MNEKIEKVKTDTEKLKEDNEKVKEGVKKVSEGVKKVSEESKRRFGRMEERLNNIEKEKEKTEEIAKEKENSEKMSDAAMANLGIQHPSSYANKVKSNEKEPVYKSKWAQKMSQVSLKKQLKIATEAAEAADGGAAAGGLEDQSGHVNRGNSARKKLRLGDSLDGHTESDWPWDECENLWDGTTDRVERNKAKRERGREKKEKKIEKAVCIGQCTLGIGPIVQKSFDYFHRITGDYGEAKKMAAAEFLTGYLKYDTNDMTDLDITDTKISGKNDNILYIVLDSPEKIKNIRRRIADCQNPAIKTREYIPPQFFKRYTALGKIAADRRVEDENLKTQIRFENMDICLYTKQRGTDEPFRPVDMEQLESETSLPVKKVELKSLAAPDKTIQTTPANTTEETSRKRYYSQLQLQLQTAAAKKREERPRKRDLSQLQAESSSSGSDDSSSSGSDGSPTSRQADGSPTSRQAGASIPMNISN